MFAAHPHGVIPLGICLHIGTNATDIDKIVERMRSAYGALPQPAVNMCDRARAKAYAAECGITSVSQVGGKVVLQPVTKELETVVYRSKEARAALNKLRAIYVPRGHKYTAPVAKGEPVLDVALDMLKAIHGAVHPDEE